MPFCSRFAAAAPTRTPSSHALTIALRTNPSTHAHTQPLRLSASTHYPLIRDPSVCARTHQPITAPTAGTGPYLYSLHGIPSSCACAPRSAVCAHISEHPSEPASRTRIPTPAGPQVHTYPDAPIHLIIAHEDIRVRAA